MVVRTVELLSQQLIGQFEFSNGLSLEFWFFGSCIIRPGPKFYGALDLPRFFFFGGVGGSGLPLKIWSWYLAVRVHVSCSVHINLYVKA